MYQNLQNLVYQCIYLISFCKVSLITKSHHMSHLAPSVIIEISIFIQSCYLCDMIIFVSLIILILYLKSKVWILNASEIQSFVLLFPYPRCQRCLPTHTYHQSISFLITQTVFLMEDASFFQIWTWNENNSAHLTFMRFKLKSHTIPNSRRRDASFLSKYFEFEIEFYFVQTQSTKKA